MKKGEYRVFVKGIRTMFSVLPLWFCFCQKR